MSTSKPFIFLAVMLTLPGCATKTYGRLEPVSAADGPMDCRALDQQITAAEVFKEDVNRKSDIFGGADVLAFLIDFGLGTTWRKRRH